jgi:PfaD family protein
MTSAATSISARSIRTWRGGEVEETEGRAGALAAGIEARGTAALASFLVDGVERVELDDGDVVVGVSRVGAEEADVRVAWRDGGSVVERIGGVGALSGAALAEALHDPAVGLHFRQGRGYRGAPSAGAELAIPALSPGSLGSAEYRSAHGVRHSYVAGAMAGGIASPELVLTMGRAGFLGYFGAGGLAVEEAQRGIARIAREAEGVPVGANLLHNPAEPAVEEATVDAFLEHGIREVDASAYMGLTPAVVRYRLHGIHSAGGRIVTPNRCTAKVSRPEVAEHFLRPAPPKIVAQLVARGALTEAQAALASKVPVAEDVTAEADSGGHTDRRPLSVLIPIFARLADRIAAEHGYAVRPRVGAAGGIGDPWSLAAALQLGAAYVMTGSINQCTAEAGTSAEVKQMLAEAGYADVTQGPAPDMFEIGAEVQVLGRGTMYAQRAAKLYELYRSCNGMEEIPAADRAKIEKQIFQRPLAEVWADTERYWAARDARELEKAAREPRHKMALAFRWYLGMTSRWARTGDSARKRDYQVWCGPAMGLFNDWVRGSWLQPVEARGVVTIARTLLHGACVAIRVGMVRNAGIVLPPEAGRVLPSRAAG